MANKDHILTSSLNIFDRKSVINSIKENKFKAEDKRDEIKVDGDIWYDDFADVKKFPKLCDFIKPDWYALVIHGNRKRICKIESVGIRRITVQWYTQYQNGKQEKSYACIRAYKIAGIIKPKS